MQNLLVRKVLEFSIAWCYKEITSPDILETRAGDCYEFATVFKAVDRWLLCNYQAVARVVVVGRALLRVY